MSFPFPDQFKVERISRPDRSIRPHIYREGTAPACRQSASHTATVLRGWRQLRSCRKNCP